MPLDFARLPAGPVAAQEAQEAAAEGRGVDREGGHHGDGGQDQREGAHVRSLEGPRQFHTGSLNDRLTGEGLDFLN